MSHFDLVDTKLKDLQYMKTPQAVRMRDFIAEHDVADVLEIGFYKGKSSAYFAAILEDRGLGHLTTIDKAAARKMEPNIIQTLESVNLSSRVTPIFAQRSHTWALGKLVRQTPRPQFDLCYFDGGHTWDVTGLGFVLVDMLLRPGGWIIFDDLDWTINSSTRGKPERAKRYASYSNEEKRSPGVRLVFETLVPHLGYHNIQEDRDLGWGFAQKL